MKELSAAVDDRITTFLRKEEAGDVIREADIEVRYAVASAETVKRLTVLALEQSDGRLLDSAVRLYDELPRINYGVWGALDRTVRIGSRVAAASIGLERADLVSVLHGAARKKFENNITHEPGRVDRVFFLPLIHGASSPDILKRVEGIAFQTVGAEKVLNRQYVPGDNRKSPPSLASELTLASLAFDDFANTERLWAQEKEWHPDFAERVIDRLFATRPEDCDRAMSYVRLLPAARRQEGLLILLNKRVPADVSMELLAE